MCVFNYKASNWVFFSNRRIFQTIASLYICYHMKNAESGGGKEGGSSKWEGVPIRTPAAQWSCCFHQVMWGSLSLIFCPWLWPRPLAAPVAYANSPRYQKRSLFQETQRSPLGKTQMDFLWKLCLCCVYCLLCGITCDLDVLENQISCNHAKEDFSWKQKYFAIRSYGLGKFRR